MTEQQAALQKSLPEGIQYTLSAPLLFLSSADVGWEDLQVQAYHEPAQLEGWVAPAVSDVSLILLTSGKMLMEILSTHGSWQGQPMHQGDLILRPGGGPINEVRWRSLSAEPMQTLHIHLSHELFSRTAAEITGSDPAHLTLYGRSNFQDPLLAQIGLALWRELEQPTSTGKLYAQTAAQMLAVHLLRYYTTPVHQIKDPTGGLTQRQVGQVKDFVLAHLNQDLSLTALSEQVGFSPYHFARLFRKTTGESPHQFVLSQRITHAKALLAESNDSLAQIALASGFANQSHFTQVFKRCLGVTPAGYRETYRIRAHF
jgi:AraC family transcriptional regulator